MKVYVLSWNDWEGEEVVGVFSTRRLAEAAATGTDPWKKHPTLARWWNVDQRIEEFRLDATKKGERNDSA